jgi:glutamine synthetase
VDQFRRIISRLYDDFGLRPVTAAELEFYLYGADACTNSSAFWQAVNAAVPLEKYEKERGREQFEIALAPAYPEKTVSDLTALKSIIAKEAGTHGMRADFSAKPLADQPGSGFHVHIHLEDANGKNVFYKDDNGISDALKYSIGGLLADVTKSMPIFAPNAQSYVRFVPGGNAPTTISWGANNRTVAVRLPDKPHDKKHIEHRVAGADADSHAVIAAILEAVYDGLTRKLDPGPQIYGDASLEMYGLPKLA